MQRTLQAADIRAFAVHAKDDGARHFYEKLDFIPHPPIRCIYLHCSKTFGESCVKVEFLFFRPTIQH
jgi:hypothetical protein